jgi:hypothetical protein
VSTGTIAVAIIGFRGQPGTDAERGRRVPDVSDGYLETQIIDVGLAAGPTGYPASVRQWRGPDR